MKTSITQGKKEALKKLEFEKKEIKKTIRAGYNHTHLNTSELKDFSDPQNTMS